MTGKDTPSKVPSGRSYPPFWEKAVPVFVVVMGFVIVIMLVIVVAVILGIFPAGG